jgi:hypothetical protein
MKKVLFVLLALTVVLLCSCEIYYSFFEPEFFALIGSWNVNLDTRPSGWNDTKYVFTANKELEIYWGADMMYKGSVTKVDASTISVTTIFSNNGDNRSSMVMCYVISNGNKSLKLGWFSGNDPIYYLDFTK